MAEIRFSPEAIDDLAETRRYITEELGSEASAKSTVRRILKDIRVLETFPELGAPLRSVVDFETPYRFLVCGNYTAFYRYEKNTVSVIRILYGRRNYMQILFGEPDGE